MKILGETDCGVQGVKNTYEYVLGNSKQLLSVTV